MISDAMKSVAHNPTLFAVSSSAVRSPASGFLILRPTEDGWSLIEPGGRVVFRGLGTASRRKCLKFAHGRGVMAVLS